ncbi:heat shock 70 kDa protein 12B-like [Crassostrea virginica]
MELQSEEMHRNTLIKDISGKSLPAMDVFSLSIKYLKDHFLKTLNLRGVLSNPENVKFVLKVPAIWNDRSKQFMRIAAIEAGIKDDHLTLALEPEAASIYCQRESAEKLSFGQQKKLTKPGTRYLVADIGGGTADFSVHEVENGGTLTELYRASGGPYGGIYVDKEYLNMYDTICGEGAKGKAEKRGYGRIFDNNERFRSQKNAP